MSRKGYPEFLNKLEKPNYLGYRINYVLRLITEQCLLVKAKKQVKNQISNNSHGKKCYDKVLKESWKIGCELPKRKSHKKKIFKWKPWKKSKKDFLSKKKYIRRKKYTKKHKKRKTCKCYLCNEEGHNAHQCPRKGKGGKKMIKFLEEKEFEVLYVEEISNIEENFYEVSSDKESFSSEEDDFIFMMQDEQSIDQITIPRQEIENLKLKDVIGEEISFIEEQIEELRKKHEIKKEEIYKLSKFKIFSARVFEQFSGNTTSKLSNEGSVDLTLFNRAKIARWKKKYPEIRYIHIGLIQIGIAALFRQGIETPILAVVLDKRFRDPIKAVIGGITSNLVNGIVWFNIKPNYFILIDDGNLEDTIRI